MRRDLEVMQAAAASRANLLSFCEARGERLGVMYMRQLTFEVGGVMADIRGRDQAVALLDEVILHLLDGTPLPGVFQMCEEKPAKPSNIWTPSHVRALAMGISFGMAIAVLLLKLVGA